MDTVAPEVDEAWSRSDDRSDLTIRPRRVWPGSRATLGGLLIAIAAIGLFTAFQRANAGPEAQYIVTRVDIAPGTILTPDHLGTQRMDLPRTLADRAFAIDEDSLVLGAVATQAMGAGELLQVSDLRAASGQAALAPYELSFRIQPDRAVAGTLRPGEIVDIIATLGSGTTAPTSSVLRSVLVLDIDRSDDPGLAGGHQVITVALDSADQAVAIVAAADKGTLTVVRVNEG